jgi:hypothetical protein
MMTELINKQKWLDAYKMPNWYEVVVDDFNKLEEIALKEKDYTKRKAIKAQAYDLVEEALKDNRIFLGQSGKDFDKERQKVDTIVIHHTGSKPGMLLSRLNTIQLLRLYARYYNNPSNEDKDIKGKAIWSNHFYKGQQVFWAYHWFIRSSGKAEHILDDKYIGWHSGNWGVNKKSISICIDDYLKDKEPSVKVIQAIADVINTNYPNVKTIIGHQEVNPKTNCPGDLFLSGWKNKLINKCNFL